MVDFEKIVKEFRKNPNDLVSIQNTFLKYSNEKKFDYDLLYNDFVYPVLNIIVDNARNVREKMTIKDYEMGFILKVIEHSSKLYRVSNINVGDKTYFDNVINICAPINLLPDEIYINWLEMALEKKIYYVQIDKITKKILEQDDKLKLFLSAFNILSRCKNNIKYMAGKLFFDTFNNQSKQSDFAVRYSNLSYLKMIKIDKFRKKCDKECYKKEGE